MKEKVNTANIRRFDGNALLYHHNRPTPPLSLLQILLDLADKKKFSSLVDLGCGTGLSSIVWSPYVEKIIGIEPNHDMLDMAKTFLKQKKINNITFQEGHSTDTCLKDESTDLITCSQSFHWMEPKPTLKEINRILKQGGIFVAYDVDWPPLAPYPLVKFFDEFMKYNISQGNEQGIFSQVKSWPKTEHLKNISESGYFAYTVEIVLNHQEKCTPERFIKLALSQGAINTLLRSGFDEQKLKLDNFEKQVKETWIKPYFNVYWNYRLRVGFK